MRSTSIFQCQLQIGGWNLEVGSYKGPIPWGQPPTSNWGLEFGIWRLEVKNGFMYHEVNFHLPMSNSNFQLEVGTWRLEVKNEYMFYEINFHLPISTSNFQLEIRIWRLEAKKEHRITMMSFFNLQLEIGYEKGISVPWSQSPTSNVNFQLEVGSWKLKRNIGDMIPTSNSQSIVKNE